MLNWSYRTNRTSTGSLSATALVLEAILGNWILGRMDGDVGLANWLTQQRKSIEDHNVVSVKMSPAWSIGEVKFRQNQTT